MSNLENQNVCATCPSRFLSRSSFEARTLNQGESTILDKTHVYRTSVQNGQPRCIHPDRLPNDDTESAGLSVHLARESVDDLDKIITWISDNIKSSHNRELSQILDALYDEYSGEYGNDSTFIVACRIVLKELSL